MKSREPRNPIERDRIENTYVSVVETRSAPYREPGSGHGKEGTPNEDAHIDLPELGVFAALDGVGGRAHGDKAATTARDTITQRLTEGKEVIASGNLEAIEALVVAALKEANQRIIDLNLEGGATTATVAVLVETSDGHKAVIGSVGDSRAYTRTPNGKLDPVDIPDLMVQRMVEKHNEQYPDDLDAQTIVQGVGEMLDTAESSDDILNQKEVPLAFASMMWYMRNQLEVALGKVADGEDEAYQTTVVAVPEGGEVLVMTDGISDQLSIRQMEEVLRKRESLVEAAFNATGYRAKKRGDDATVVRAKVRPKKAEEIA